MLKTAIGKALASTDANTCNDIFNKIDGEHFLSQEIGLEGEGRDTMLPPIGKEVARLVGYQKFALMMVGNMISPPVKSKRKAMDWSQVLAFVQSIRNEMDY